MNNVQIEMALCVDCNCILGTDEMENETVNGLVCDDCLENEYSLCDECGEYYRNDDLVCGDNYTTLCESCFDDLYTTCDHCGDSVKRSEVVEDNHITLCEHCYESNFTTCNECGDIINFDWCYSDDYGDCYCESCWNDRSGNDLRDSHDNPDIRFNGSGDYHYGVEIEIDGGNDKLLATRLTKCIFPDEDEVFCKEDCSLNYGGIEIVTQPCTLDYHIDLIPRYNQLFNDLVRAGNDNRYGNAGLHVHVSREAFGTTYLERRFNISKLILLVDKLWTDIKVVSRRKNESALYSWAARNRAGNWTSDSWLGLDEMYERASDDRYHAINCTNTDTVELRIFSGATCTNDVIGGVLLYENFIRWAIDTDIEVINQRVSLSEYIEDGMIDFEGQLANYLDKLVF